MAHRKSRFNSSGEWELGQTSILQMCTHRKDVLMVSEAHPEVFCVGVYLVSRTESGEITETKDTHITSIDMTHCENALHRRRSRQSAAEDRHYSFATMTCDDRRERGARARRLLKPSQGSRWAA